MFWRAIEKIKYILHVCRDAMPSESIYLPAPQMDVVDNVIADTDAQNRSQAIQHIIEDYHDA